MIANTHAENLSVVCNVMQIDGCEMSSFRRTSRHFDSRLWTTCTSSTMRTSNLEQVYSPGWNRIWPKSTKRVSASLWGLLSTSTRDYYVIPPPTRCYNPCGLISHLTACGMLKSNLILHAFMICTVIINKLTYIYLLMKWEAGRR